MLLHLSSSISCTKRIRTPLILILIQGMVGLQVGITLGEMDYDIYIYIYGKLFSRDFFLQEIIFVGNYSIEVIVGLQVAIIPAEMNYDIYI